jgi:hypothetical protein
MILQVMWGLNLVGAMNNLVGIKSFYRSYAARNVQGMNNEWCPYVVGLRFGGCCSCLITAGKASP